MHVGASATEDVEVVGSGFGAAAEDGDDDPEPDDHFGGGEHEDKEAGPLTADVVQLPGVGDEGEVDGVEHQLDAHEHDQHVPADQQSDGPDGEQGRAQAEVPAFGETHGVEPSISSPISRSGRRASTTAPTTAMISSTDVISNGSR